MALPLPRERHSRERLAVMNNDTRLSPDLAKRAARSGGA